MAASREFLARFEMRPSAPRPGDDERAAALGGIVAAVIPSKLPETVAVHEHGELGPVLGSPEHDFTGPGDLK